MLNLYNYPKYYDIAFSFGISANFIKADMRNFSLGTPVDFVYVMLGSLYAKTNEDLFSHFNSVAQALNPGGLYFLDWCINFQWDEALKKEDSWSMEQEGIKVEVKFINEDVINRATQVCKHKLIMDVDDKGEKLHLETEEINRTIFPQEFLLLVEKSKKFEFVGWWNNWNLEEPIEKAEHISRPITLVRRI